MDVLSDLLRRSGARNAVVRQLIQAPPWSFHLVDPGPLSAVATLEGSVTVTLSASERDDPGPDAATHTVGAGDIALIRGGRYSLADSPTTPCQIVVREGRRYPTADGADTAGLDQLIAPRTFGGRQPGSITMLTGTYQLHGSAGDRLLRMLPRFTVVPASSRTRPPLEMLATEAGHDEPGQDAVLNRLLDLVLVVALRAWGSGAGAHRRTWLGAASDPTIGRALSALHADPQHPWTTTTLAEEVGVSRAALCARFTDLVDQPPMAYLTGWRMTLAADALRDSDATVAVVARDVGYHNPYSFSTAFKRVHGESPTTWRRRALRPD